MCVCAHVYLCVGESACTLGLCLRALCMFVHSYIYTRTHACMDTHIYTYVVCVCVCMCVCVCVCVIKTEIRKTYFVVCNSKTTTPITYIYICINITRYTHCGSDLYWRSHEVFSRLWVTTPLISIEHAVSHPGTIHTHTHTARSDTLGRLSNSASQSESEIGHFFTCNISANRNIHFTYPSPASTRRLPASAPRLVYQKPWYVLSCLWDGAYKRTLAANWKD